MPELNESRSINDLELAKQILTWSPEKLIHYLEGFYNEKEAAVKAEKEKWQANHRELWESLNLIYDAIAELAVGILPNQECEPDCKVYAERIIKAVRELLTNDEAAVKQAKQDVYAEVLRFAERLKTQTSSGNKDVDEGWDEAADTIAGQIQTAAYRAKGRKGND